LSQNTSLLSSFKAAVSERFANESGVPESAVTVVLSAGSVKAAATIRVPLGVNIDDLTSKMSTTSTLGASIAAAVKGLPGVDAVSNGPIGVSGIVASKATEAGQKGKESAAAATVVSVAPRKLAQPTASRTDDKQQQVSSIQSTLTKKANKTMDIMMLELRTHSFTRQTVDDLIEHYNTYVQSVEEVSVKMPVASNDLELDLAQQYLQTKRETTNGVDFKLVVNEDQHKSIAQLLAMAHMLMTQRHAASKESGSGKRSNVIQELAATLGVDYAALRIFFDLVAPESTKRALTAVKEFTKSDLGESSVQAVVQFMGYTQSCLPVFHTVRNTIGDFSDRFGLPRHLGPAMLMSTLSHPPQNRDIFSVLSYLMSPLLGDSRYSNTVQRMIGDMSSLVCHATNIERASDLAKTFGIVTAENAGHKAVEGLMKLFLCNTAGSKLLYLLPAIDAILKEVVARNPDASVAVLRFWEVLPVLLFFAGFPYALVPVDGPEGRTKPAVELIGERTGIPQEVLGGVEFCQVSISNLSSSRYKTLDSKCALALLLPMLNAVRQTRPHLAKELPSGDLLKAIISLAFCEIENLEALADALGLDTFMLQLLVLLVKVSRNSDSPKEMSKIVQRIRTSSGIMKELSGLGLRGDRFLALLELSFPRLEEAAMLPIIIDKLGLHYSASTDILRMLYTLACCAQLHRRGVAEPSQHEIHTSALCDVVAPLCNDLGYSRPLVVILSSRLLQGDFRVLRSAALRAEAQLLLPLELEQEVAIAVCGLLSHRPPSFVYHPVVVSGVARVCWPEDPFGSVEEGADGRGSFLIARVKVDTPLPGIRSMREEPVFTFRLHLGKDSEFSRKHFACEALDICFADADKSPDGQDHNSSSRVHRRDSFTIKVTCPPGFSVDKGGLDVRWQACPPVDSDELRSRQLASAAEGLQQVEKFSRKAGIHWGGVAKQWKDELNVHPLFLLLAAGNVNAIRLAADMLAIPEVVVAFLFGLSALTQCEPHKGVPAEVARASVMRPLLLGDLCIPSILSKIFKEHPYFLETETLKQVAAAQLKQPTLGMMGKMGSASTIAAARSVEPVAAAEAEDEDGEEDRDGEEGDASEEEEELHRSRLSLARSKVMREGAAAASHADVDDDDDGAKWLKEVEPKDFPDPFVELLGDNQYFSEDRLRDPFNHLPGGLGDAVWLHWESDGENPDSVAFMEAALDGLEELDVDVSEDVDVDIGDASAAHTLIERWKEPCPDNTHVLFSIVLVQLYALVGQTQTERIRPLDASPEVASTTEALVNGAPSVSLIIALSQLHQARGACKVFSKEKRVAIAQNHLFPAMWGIECHLRKALDRQARTQMRTKLQSVHEHENSHREYAWTHGPLGGFKVPVELKANIKLNAETEERETWMWQAWRWPRASEAASADVFVDMTCRVVQVARYALGANEAIEFIHPDDEVLGDEMADSQRGWESILGSPSLAAQSEVKSHQRQLVQDIFNAEAASLSLVFAACGGDWAGKVFSVSRITTDSVPDCLKPIVEHGTFYDAILGLLSSRFDAPAFTDLPSAEGEQLGKKAPIQWECLGEAIRSVLPTKAPPAGLRINACVEVLCQDIGMPPQLTEALLLTAHGYCSSPDGQMVSPKCFQMLATRLGLQQGGARLMNALCKDFSMFSEPDAEILALALGLSEELLFHIVSAVRGSVRGWRKLYTDFISAPVAGEDDAMVTHKSSRQKIFSSVTSAGGRFFANPDKYKK
jgi:hypothetical protein